MAGNDNGKSIGDLVANANANQSKVVDTTSPYYLHPCDHPGLIFVTHPLSERGDNYFTWRRSFMNALHSKNKASFVDGKIAKPEIDSPDLQSWIQCNTVVLSWVTSALAKELQGNVAHVETARDIWKDLEECTGGAARKMSSMREEERVFDFLMGLDEAYTTVRSQILSVDPLSNVGRAYAIAAQEEKSLQIVLPPLTSLR
ncbi:hypothetical protein RJ639_014191 [Escallonia herrerae]|uniref:Retrotransposon Copia-like N-terminal domain-containing protein n=1 Tax=Escallonia herrerae TaxID=1293975 RepID=A0AA89ADG2_9ASTE|nr:hypothetical protein RJ639_023326 [Escallonia herrerae]KAK3008864.1 hypothetical protein RJ639_014191 [Escallonia herrerae]